MESLRETVHRSAEASISQGPSSGPSQICPLLLQNILRGDFARCNLTPNFDNPNQTARYDVLTGVKNLEAEELKKARARIKAARGEWFPDPQPIEWQTTDEGRSGGSGVIYITSNRSKWFAENACNCPILLWCLYNDKNVDILTDPLEYDAYKERLRGDDDALVNSLCEQLNWIHQTLKQDYDSQPYTPERVKAHFNVVAPTQSAVRGQPRGFGYNRYVGMECMRARFDGACATVDDNTFKFTRPTWPALDSIFSEGYMNGRGEWLSVAFSPCTVSNRLDPTELMDFDKDVFGGEPHGSDIRPATLDNPKIIQQFTLWNAGAYRDMANPPNYDRSMLTGKEDVELYGRLMRADEGRMFTDASISLVKCKSESDKPKTNPGARQKENVTLRKMVLQTQTLDPTGPWQGKEEDDQRLLEVAEKYGIPRPAENLDAASRGQLVAKVVRRQNMALEQILVPNVGGS